MIHEIIPVGMLRCNCSIVGDEATGEAVVIDPGDDIDRVKEILARHNLSAKYIVATQDHIFGMARMFQITSRGRDALQVVRTPQDVYTALGLTTPRFERLDTH